MPLENSLESDAVDLYCMGCGYNLRGQIGDPRRCPECGRQNSVQLMQIPAARIKRQLRLLESAPTYCFMGSTMALISLVMPGIRVVASRGTLDGKWLIFVGFFLLLGVVCAYVGGGQFRRSCCNHPDWLRALLKFHAYAAAIFALFLSAVLSIWVVAIYTMGSSTGLIRWPGTIVALVVAYWFLAVALIYRLYRRLRAMLDPLQRAAAVDMYLNDPW